MYRLSNDANTSDLEMDVTFVVMSDRKLRAVPLHLQSFCVCYFLDVVHKFVRDGYYKRFPELESLVHLPLEYVKTVKVC